MAPNPDAPTLLSRPRRAARWLARLELWLVLALAPFFLFPQPAWTPWLLLAVGLLWLARWLGRGRPTVPTPLDGPLLGLGLMTLVSLWATYDWTLSFPKLCGVALGLALFYALVNGLRSRRAVWWAAAALVAGGAAVAGLSLVAARWSGPKVPALVPLFEPLYEGLPRWVEGVPRAERGFDPNQLGGTLALFVPLSATLLFYRLRHRPRRADWIGWLSSLGLALALLLTLFVLLLTQSRMAYVGTAAGLLLALALQGHRPGLIALLTLLLGVGLALNLGLEDLGEAIFGIPNLEALSDETSWAGRVEIWQRAWRVVQDHPLTGIGFDTLPPVVHARYPTFLLQASNDFTHAHNIFLQIGLNLGLPGLAAFLWLLLAWGRMMWQVGREAASPAQRALAGALVAGLVGNFVFGLGDAVDLGSKPGVFMWACFGLGAALWLQVRADAAPEAAKSPVRRRPSLLRALSILAVVLFLIWGYSQFARVRAWRSLLEADLDAFERLSQEGAEAIAPQTPAELVRNTHADLRRFRAEWSLPLKLAPHLCWLPGYGPDLQAAPILLDIGLDLSAAGERALDALAPLWDASPAGGPGGLERAVASLQNARPQLESALDSLEQARLARRSICTARLSPQTREWVARLDEMLPLLENGVRCGLALPELLGGAGRRTYLVLIQNDDELRPTGGFISGAARLVLERGQVVELSFHDSYDVDDLSQPYPAPPRPLREIMGSEMWLFRDSNWNPNFGTSARVARELYRLYDPSEVDGVLALDQQALQSLVAALGPLQVPEQPDPITGENVIQILRQSWAPGAEGFTEDWRERRKDFIGRLLTAAVNRLQNESAQVDMLALGLALVQALEQRHLSVYLMGDAPLAQTLHQAGWDGAILQTPGDYWMLVDANLGFNKVNPYITERLSYTLDLRDPTQPRATLDVVHRHQGPDTGAPCRHQSRFDLTYEQMMARCYWDYVRLYVPQGSRPLHVTPHPIPADLILTGQERAGWAERLPDEAGKSVFATFLVLAPGEWAETRFVYDLPPDVLRWDGNELSYRLLVQKQAGTGGHPIQVRLILPAGAEVLDAFPPPQSHDGDVYRHEWLLETDVELEYVVRVPETK